ncbi:hypothetical protein LguiB_002866 [Lonicera macranthoides]
MGQRNILYTSPMIGLEMDPQGGQGHLHPEPCILYRNIASFPQPNVHTILPPQVNRTISEHQGPLSYGVNQYNGVHHNHPGGNINLSAPSNPYNMFMNPSSSTRVFPIPLSHGPHDPLPFSSNHGIIEIDGFGGAFKRKNAEGYPGNFQFCFPSVGSSSSGAPTSARPLESDVAVMDGGSFPLPKYRSGVDTVLAHNSNRMIQGNHLGQPYQTAGAPWNQAPALPYLHGSMNGGCMETANMCIQGTPFLHPPPPIPQGHPNLHHIPPPPMHGARGPNIDFHSQIATSSSRRFPTNSTSHTSMNPFQDGGVEVGPRFVGPVPPNSLRIYRPPRRDMMLDANPRQRNLPHLRVLPEDGVAILDISGYHEVGDSIDHHRDMRLDIDHMSYEELLALGEQIGSVGTGLSEEIITRHLKTRMFESSSYTSYSNLEEAELSCVICQGEYEEQESIGVLNCGHKYHVDCIKKWLLVKNICPICKSSAFALSEKDS